MVGLLYANSLRNRFLNYWLFPNLSLNFLSLGAKTAEHLTLIKANLKKVQMGQAVKPDDKDIIENESIEQLEIEYDWIFEFLL